MAARAGAHRAKDRSVLLSAAPDAGHERGLGDVLASPPDQRHVRCRADRSGHTARVPALAHERHQAAGLCADESLRARLRGMERNQARVRVADRRRPGISAGHRGQGLARDLPRRHAKLSRREFLAAVPDAKVGARLSADEHSNQRRLDHWVVSHTAGSDGFKAIRTQLAASYRLESFMPEMSVVRYGRDSDRKLTVQHQSYNGRLLQDDEAEQALKHLRWLWGFDVTLEAVAER